MKRLAQSSGLAGLLVVSVALLGAAPAAAQFGFRPGSGFSAVAEAEGGSPDLQAGSHPVALSASFEFNLAPESPGEPGVPFTEGDIRDLGLELPPGLVEDPAAIPQCTQAAFHAPRFSPFEESQSGENCPERTQVGVVEVRSSAAGGETRTFGLFNLVPPPGAPSELGFNAYGAPVAFIPHVRQGEGEYGITLEARDVPQLVDINGLILTIWGNPWANRHNDQRGNCLNEAEPSFGWAKCRITEAATPYLTMPTACDEPLTYTATATSWQQSQQATSTYVGPTLRECEGLRFEPRPFTFVTNPRASSPSGVDFNLDANNPGILDPHGRASSPVRKLVVSLPEGVTINPSVGAGLGSCSQSQYGAETATSAPGAGCPNDSKIGDFTVKTPLFPDETLEGSLFLASPHDNPFGTLLAVYLVAKAPQRGILVKVAGRLDADAASGRLTATFDRLPQLPYSNLRVFFREGQRSPLATPAACGAFPTQMQLSPWRAPGQALQVSSAFTVSAGVGGGPCPRGTPPFAPGSQAGSLNSRAGTYSPFYLHLTRNDTEQEITSYSASFPPGLTGRLAGIPFCPEAAIEAAKHNTGFAESEHPSCPAASSIGHTVAGYGLGSVLAYAPGGLYLAGPFHGSTFSVVAIDSATVGPFDLGTIVVRSAIEINPQTAQVTLDSAGSDPIPHIVDGIPIHLRDVRVYISHPDLTLNPTSCEPFSVTSMLSGSGASFANSADDTSAAAPSNYQAVDCASLGFKPDFRLRLRGGVRRGDFPALRAEVRPRAGDANFATAAVTLPHSEFLAQEHIDTVCTRAQFAREACPAGSVYGWARVFTPLLGAPLEGKVYLRTSEHTLPDLVAALRGGGIGVAIDIVGRIDSVQGGLRARFGVLPDAPFSKFVMKLYGGKRGLLANSEGLCVSKPRRAKVRFVGQNGLGEKLGPALSDPKCRRKRARRHRIQSHPKHRRAKR